MPHMPRDAPRYQPLVIVLASASAGVAADRFFPLSLATWWAGALGGLALWAVLAKQGRLRTAQMALLLSAAVAAGAWHHCCWRLFADDDLSRFARAKGQPICVELIAHGAPRKLPPLMADEEILRGIPSSDVWQLEVELVGLRNGAAWQPASGWARLYVQEAAPQVSAGDRLRCFGQLSALPRPMNPGQTDRGDYLRAERVTCQLTVDAPECLATIQLGSPWSFSRLLQQVRDHGRQTLQRFLDPRQAELASAVLLGLREELEPGRNEAFFTTGTIHILSISGLHVGILAGALFWTLWRTSLPRGWTTAIVAATTLFYAILVDARPPVVRATILVLVACGSMYLGRRKLGMNTLAAAGLVLLAINPAQLFQVGAQLSFLCVAGLIWIASRRPHAEDAFVRAGQTISRLVEQNLSLPQRALRRFFRGVCGLFLAGLAIWALTLPLTMARFHLISLATLWLNVLVVPLVSICVLSGIVVLIIGAICPPLDWLLGRLCDAGFGSLETLVDTAAQWPMSHYWTPGPAVWWLLVFYGALALWAALPQWRPPRRWIAAIAAGWIAVGLCAAQWPGGRDRLDCTFLSMGHGCAVVLELPDGRTLLYDAGRFGSPRAGMLAISNCLWQRGITRLDAVVLSHADVDHYNALPGLLERFSVDQIFVSPTMFDRLDPAMDVLRRAIERHGAPVVEIRAGDNLRRGGGCQIEVLHPPRWGVLGSDNANSVVLAVRYLDHEILLPGDLESPGLADVLAEEPRHCEVLLAPHHGSRKSNSPELAAWCRPRWVVLSGDGRWSLPEIDATYRRVGARVLHTHDAGAVRVRIDARGVQAAPCVASRW